MIDNHFLIGENAHEIGPSLRMIRYDEELELISPSGRSEGGFRPCATDGVARLVLHNARKPLGMPLETMRELISSTLDALDRCDRIDHQVTRARDVLLSMSAGSLEATG